MNNPWNDPSDPLDRPILTPELAALIEKQASKSLDEKGQRLLETKLAQVAKEQEEKKRTPRLSLPENRRLLHIATKAGEQDGDLIVEFKKWLGGFNSGYITDPSIQDVLVKGFVSIIEGFDEDNHPVSGRHYDIRASDMAVLNCCDELMDLPVIADKEFSKQIAQGLAGQIIRPAITAACKLGITRPGITKDLYIREQAAPKR